MVGNKVSIKMIVLESICPASVVKPNDSPSRVGNSLKSIVALADSMLVKNIVVIKDMESRIISFKRVFTLSPVYMSYM